MLHLLLSLFVIVAVAKPDGKPEPKGDIKPDVKPDPKEGKPKPEPKEKKLEKLMQADDQFNDLNVPEQEQQINVQQEEQVNVEVQADDQINLQPMRDCTQCWECYTCTHDEHYGTVGNCVPILGCIPSECYGDGDCGEGRKCVFGSCKNEACSEHAECGYDRVCYYGECRDKCKHSSECNDNKSGDICEHGLCVCSGSMC